MDLALINESAMVNCGSVFADSSFASGFLKSGQFFKTTKPIDNKEKLNSKIVGNPGMALASRVETIKNIGFYDGSIVGGGDTILLAALTNNLDLEFEYRLFSRPH